MPAVSQKQRMAIAIAEHHPDELYGRNKAMLGMSHQQQHDFASTPQKGLPVRKRMADGGLMLNSRFTSPAPPPRKEMPKRPGTPPPMRPLPHEPASGGPGGVAGGGHPSFRDVREMAEGDAVAPPPPDDPNAAAASGPSPIEDSQWPMLLDYRGEHEVCQACQYMQDDGMCPVVKTQVDPGGHCKAFQPKEQAAPGAEGSPSEEAGETPQFEAQEEEPQQ